MAGGAFFYTSGTAARTEKLDICGRAIERIEAGIANLKTLGYDAEKTAKYELKLAKFRQLRDKLKNKGRS